MQVRQLQRNSRKSFTLLELVVAIGIILVLVSLSLAALMKILYKKAEVVAKNDMTQLDAGITAFMQNYGVEYIPSQIKLCQNSNSYSASQLDQDSKSFISKTIGKNSPGFMKKWGSTGIQWVQGMPAGGVEILQGHQCLVFFLGGIVFQNGSQYYCTGFSTDPTNPDAAPTPGTNRIGPFFAFDPNRLMLDPNKPNTYFPAYVDAYGIRTGIAEAGATQMNGKPQFYAYFSSYKHQNGYNRYTSSGSLASSASAAVSDCSSLQNVWPYASTSTPSLQYVRPNDWQIICAGFDGMFGPGTNPTATTPYYWNQTTAAQIPQVGHDDQANFAFGKLVFGE
jgi:type II secretory pathway pseudopilin PulG